MTDSILTSVKQSLGLAEDYEVYDPELIMHINSVLGTLNQLGVGPDDGFEIADKTETWDHLLTNEGALFPDKRLSPVRSYMFHRVKMLFDPPTVGYLVTAIEKMIEQAEWRIMVAQDNILNPYVPPPVTTDDGLDVVLDPDEVTINPETDRIIFDGGSP